MFDLITKPAGADDARYVSKTVRAIRGTEARTIAKWQEDGWELASQDQGLLRTEITFRRPKPEVPWRLVALVGGLVLLVVVIVVGVVLVVNRGGGGASEPTASPTEVATAPSGQSSTDSPAAPATTASEATPTQPAAEETLTAANNAELAAVLTVSDPNDPLVAAFATAHRGRVIEFDANIADMTTHGDYETRFDILVGAGDFSPTSMTGPYFQFRDVNVTSDLGFTGANVPDYIGTGTNVHVVAEVVGYESASGLFLLEPVSTQVR